MNIGSMIRGLLGDNKAGEAKSLELKEGQVVRGVVLSVSESGKEAVVQIQGTPVRAELETPLQPGQTLNLQVSPPGEGGLPILKPVTMGEAALLSPQSMGEALETLGLTESKAGREIVQAMQSGGLAMTKETAAKLNAIMSAKPPGVPAEQWLEAAVISVKRGLPVTTESVKGLQQAIFGPQLHQLLSALEEQVSLWTGQKDGKPETASANAQSNSAANASMELGKGLASSKVSNAVPTMNFTNGASAVNAANDGDSTATNMAKATETANAAAGAVKGAGDANAAAGAVKVAGDANAAAGAANGAGDVNAAAGAAKGAGDVNAAAGAAKDAGNVNAAAGATKGAGDVNAAAGAAKGAGDVNAAAGTAKGAGDVNTAAGVAKGAGDVNAAAGAAKGEGDVNAAAGAAKGAGDVNAAAGAAKGAGDVNAAAGTAQGADRSGAPLLAKLQGVLSELRGTLPQLAQVPPAASMPRGDSPAAAAQPLQGTAATHDTESWVGRVLKLLGAEHEQQAVRGGASTAAEGRQVPLAPAALGASVGAQERADTLKGVLLQLMGSSEIPAALKEAAGQLVQHMTGQQLLLNTDRTTPFAQVTLFLPLQGANGEETASVHIQSRRGRKGELDAANCRLWFDLDMKQLGQTLVDVQVVDHIVSLKLHNNNPEVLELLEQRREDIKLGVEAIGYQLSSLRTEPLPVQKLTDSEAGTSKLADFVPDSYRGVDYRI